MPSATNAPKPPAHLSPAARDFFTRIVADYTLESSHLKLLTLLCEASDRGTQARLVLAESGITYNDRFGCPHAHPCVAIERDSRTAVARLCRELDLDADPIALPARPPALNSNRRR